MYIRLLSLAAGLLLCVLWSTNNNGVRRRAQVVGDNGVIVSNPHINILEDGTLLVYRMPESAACSYFVNLPNLPKRVDPSPTRIHYHFDHCGDDELGKQLSEHFGHFLLANAAQVPYTMTCGNGEIDPGSVMSQLQVNNAEPGPPPVDVTGHQYSVYDVCISCYGLSWWCEKGPELMYDIAGGELQKLALSSFGQSVEPEDAVVHLRLGNALLGGRDEGIGLLPFRSYSRLLRRAETESGPLQTISVVTQTFDPEHARPEDREASARSEAIATAFLDHLRENFPNAVVKLHSSHLDTPFVAYIRLVKASKVVICGSTTFCTYPALSNPGIRYLFKSDTLNPWVQRLQYNEKLRPFESPRLANNYIGALTDSQLLHWLRHQNPNGNDVITGPPLFRVPKTKFTH